jgi:hypothetical protein
MIRRIALSLCPLVLGCILAATPALARSGIVMPGFVGSGSGSGIGLSGFPGSGPGFPGMPRNSVPALPPNPTSSPGVTTPAPSVTQPYLNQPSLGSVSSVP